MTLNMALKIRQRIRRLIEYYRRRLVYQKDPAARDMLERLLIQAQEDIKDLEENHINLGGI
jgi:hypothetical protein